MAAIPIQQLELLVSEVEKGASSESQLSSKRPQYRKRTRPTLLLHREEDLFCLLSLTCYCYKLLEELCKSSLALILVPLIVSLAKVVARNLWSHPSRKQSTWMRRASSLALPVMMSLSMNNAASILLFGHLDFNMTILSVVLFAGGCAVRFSSTAVVCDEPIGDSKPPEVGDQAGRSCVASQGSRERDISAPGSTSEPCSDPAYLSFQQVVPEQRQRQVPADSIGSRAAEKSLMSCRVEAGPGAMAPSVAVWVLESGAGFHMTGNLQLLRDGGNLVTYDHQLADALRMSDGDRSLHILGCGSVKTDRIEVPNVRYLQGLTVNVISVLQLAREHSLEVTFEPRYCYIRKSGGQIVGRGARSRNGIYVLEYLRIRLEDDASLNTPMGTSEDDGSPPQAGPDPNSWSGLSPSDIPTVNSCCDHVFTGRSTLETSTGTFLHHFYMDSGAYCHSTGDESVLQTYPDHLNVRKPISSIGGVISGASIPVEGCGYVNRDEVLQLDGVLHIPGSSANLVSVGQLAKEYDARIVFEKDFFRVESLQQNGVTIGQGHREKDSNLYVLDYFRPGVLFVDSPTPTGFSVLFGNVKIPQQPS